MTIEAPVRNKAGKKHAPEFVEKLLKEAEESSVHGTAIRYGLNPSQLFVWRKIARLTAAANANMNGQR